MALAIEFGVQPPCQPAGEIEPLLGRDAGRVEAVQNHSSEWVDSFQLGSINRIIQREEQVLALEINLEIIRKISL